MIAKIVFILYQLLLPLFFIAVFPGWILKMAKRGGFKTPLLERLGFYRSKKQEALSGAIHLHAISVGETMLAMKLLKAWRQKQADASFVIAVGTATAYRMASEAGISGVTVTYAPLDFGWMLRRYFLKFQPSRILLIEGEIWPNFLLVANRLGVRVDLANARTSPRSARRLLRFAEILRPFVSKLSSVCIQEEEHRELWESLGVLQNRIHLTGSLKFDPENASQAQPDPKFQKIIDSFGEGRPVVLAASTFSGEEEWIAKILRNYDSKILPVIVPRHAERRNEVSKKLREEGFTVTLRSQFYAAIDLDSAVFLIDSTGELATWISHADVVIIGKSILAKGGQNPAEAINAGKPLIFGPYMHNFQPLADRLVSSEAAYLAYDEKSLERALQKTLDPNVAAGMTHKAKGILASHAGATERHLSVLQVSDPSA